MTSNSEENERTISRNAKYPSSNPFIFTEKENLPRFHDAFYVGTVSKFLHNSTFDELAKHPIDFPTVQGRCASFDDARINKLLEERNEDWFRSQKIRKIQKGDSPTPSTVWTLPGLPFREEHTLEDAVSHVDSQGRLVDSVAQSYSLASLPSPSISTQPTTSASASFSLFLDSQPDQPVTRRSTEHGDRATTSMSSTQLQQQQQSLPETRSSPRGYLKVGQHRDGATESRAQRQLQQLWPMLETTFSPQGYLEVGGHTDGAMVLSTRQQQQQQRGVPEVGYLGISEGSQDLDYSGGMGVSDKSIPVYSVSTSGGPHWSTQHHFTGADDHSTEANEQLPRRQRHSEESQRFEELMHWLMQVEPVPSNQAVPAGMEAARGSRTSFVPDTLFPQGSLMSTPLYGAGQGQHVSSQVESARVSPQRMKYSESHLPAAHQSTSGRIEPGTYAQQPGYSASATFFRPPSTTNFVPNNAFRAQHVRHDGRPPPQLNPSYYAASSGLPGGHMSPSTVSPSPIVLIATPPPPPPAPPSQTHLVLIIPGNSPQQQELHSQPTSYPVQPLMSKQSSPYSQGALGETGAIGRSPIRQQLEPRLQEATSPAGLFSSKPYPTNASIKTEVRMERLMQTTPVEPSGTPDASKREGRQGEFLQHTEQRARLQIQPVFEPTANDKIYQVLENPLPEGRGSPLRTTRSPPDGSYQKRDHSPLRDAEALSLSEIPGTATINATGAAAVSVCLDASGVRELFTQVGQLIEKMPTRVTCCCNQTARPEETDGSPAKAPCPSCGRLVVGGTGLRGKEGTNHSQASPSQEQASGIKRRDRSVTPTRKTRLRTAATQTTSPPKDQATQCGFPPYSPSSAQTVSLAPSIPFTPGAPAPWYLAASTAAPPTKPYGGTLTSATTATLTIPAAAVGTAVRSETTGLPRQPTGHSMTAHHAGSPTSTANVPVGMLETVSFHTTGVQSRKEEAASHNEAGTRTSPSLTNDASSLQLPQVTSPTVATATAAPLPQGRELQQSTQSVHVTSVSSYQFSPMGAYTPQKRLRADSFQHSHNNPGAAIQGTLYRRLFTASTDSLAHSQPAHPQGDYMSNPTASHPTPHVYRNPAAPLQGRSSDRLFTASIDSLAHAPRPYNSHLSNPTASHPTPLSYEHPDVARQGGNMLNLLDSGLRPWGTGSRSEQPTQASIFTTGTGGPSVSNIHSRMVPRVQNILNQSAILPNFESVHQLHQSSAGLEPVQITSTPLALRTPGMQGISGLHAGIKRTASAALAETQVLRAQNIFGHSANLPSVESRLQLGARSQLVQPYLTPSAHLAPHTQGSPSLQAGSKNAASAALAENPGLMRFAPPGALANISNIVGPQMMTAELVSAHKRLQVLKATTGASHSATSLPGNLMTSVIGASLQPHSAVRPHPLEHLLRPNMSMLPPPGPTVGYARLAPPISTPTQHRATLPPGSHPLNAGAMSAPEMLRRFLAE